MKVVFRQRLCPGRMATRVSEVEPPITLEGTMRADTAYLTTQDLATRWQLSQWTIRDYARRGLITGVTRAGRQLRFAPDAMLADVRPGPQASNAAGENLDSFFDDFARQLAQTRTR